MTKSYDILILISFLTDLVLIANTLSNRNINTYKRSGFLGTYILIMLCSICEWSGILINGLNFSSSLISVHYLVKTLELSITPFISFWCANTVFSNRLNNHFIRTNIDKVFAFLLILHIALVVSTRATHGIFFIDENNVYRHGPFYYEYIFMFILFGVRFFVKAFQFSQKHQNSNSTMLTSILLFITFGVLIQIADSTFKTCWLTLSIASSFVYVYYLELTQYTDTLTQLLNKRAYSNRIQRLNCSYTLIMFDVDDFKKVNDNYGHKVGDEVLRIVAECIFETYRDYGNIYRIGGDEFAAILTKPITDMDKLNRKFIALLMEHRSAFKSMPYVSFGISYHKKFDTCSVEEVENSADQEMYCYKSISKHERGSSKGDTS